MKGRRVMPDADGWLPANFEPGDYGRATCNDIKEDSALGWWQCCSPTGDHGSLNPAVHTVTEHEDGTITVSPSLDFSKRKPGAYHGFLVRGVWS
jgi:hypothetical protein